MKLIAYLLSLACFVWAGLFMLASIGTNASHEWNTYILVVTVSFAAGAVMLAAGAILGALNRIAENTKPLA